VCPPFIIIVTKRGEKEMKKTSFILMFLSLLILSCTVDNFKGQIKVDAEILGYQDTSVLIKMKIDNVEIYDKLSLSENLAIFAEWKFKKLTTVPLTVEIIGIHACFDKTAYLTYYYKENKICKSETVSYPVIRKLATEKREFFSWKVMNGKKVNEPPKIESETL